MSDDFDFWQDHSETFLTMAYLWDRRHSIDNPDGYGKKTGDCGDTVTLYLTIRNDTVKEIHFEADGCLNTSACCNGLAELIEGKAVDDAWRVTAENVVDFLETLPEDHYHCAELTVGTLYLALNQYNNKSVKGD